MSVILVYVGLQASRRDGRGVNSSDFLVPLQIQEGEVDGTHADAGPWTSGMVDLVTIRLSAFDHVDPELFTKTLVGE